MTIDQKIDRLRELTSNFLFIDFYSHTDTYMWKILNEHTKYSEETLVLCPYSDGIEKAIDTAIKSMEEKKRVHELDW